VNNLSNSSMSDLTYSVVKAYAKKGSLLSRPELENLAESKNLDELVNRLRATSYNEEVGKIEQPYSPINLELAFRENLAKIHYTLIKIAPNSQLIRSYYLQYIGTNLKTILKGKALDKSYDELIKNINLFPEQLIGRRDIVIKALSSNNLDEAVNILLESEFKDEIEKAYKTYQNKNEFQIFDIYIDKAIFQGIINQLLKVNNNDRQKISEIVSTDIDSYNLLAILRSKLWNIDKSVIKELLIYPTFKISSNILKKIIQTDSITEAIKYLNVAEYKNFIQTTNSDEEIISKLERGFKILTYKKSKKSFLWNAFDSTQILGLIKLKEIECENLSSIAFGVKAGMEFQNIIKKLTLI
tara:strand:- start:166 stop:1230 length:1065 start_codon:yes stop_codon:yes gene_type:complete